MGCSNKESQQHNGLRDLDVDFFRRSWSKQSHGLMWPGAEVQGRGGEYEQQQESPDLEGPAPPLFHIYVNFAWRGNVIFSWAAMALLYH